MYSKTHWIRGLSLRSWLAKSELPDAVKSKVFALHVNGSDKLKQAYSMKVRDDDCFIDIKNVILVGEK